MPKRPFVVNLLNSNTWNLVLKRSKTTKSGALETKSLYVPYIPPNAVADTVAALKDRESLREILNLVSGASDSLDSLEHRRIFQKVHEAYMTHISKLRRYFSSREDEIRSNVLEAIAQLPLNLYEEAVCSNVMHEHLCHKRVFRNDWLATLSSLELQKLDTYRMLMYLRYPFAQIKSKQPGLFWIQQSKAINRQKQASLFKGRK
ncbi:hypothetical protein BdWA1_000844 [Babesia duncani]|uniref:Uncharacterized protein n=1 Tax=Babesia duncani TaxID=323732 RepID=A0AAD9PNJ6_9APIC|nr:hypothetical protein BdWA1_000844 [Babesia duncani]